VYIDGGHSRWLPAAEIANRLNLVGINHARGFSLNTSNFFSTDEETGYGEDISGRTGGAHYVIDTSRNGVGPAPDAPLNWCNPAAGHSACRLRRRPRVVMPTPTSGSSVLATQTDRADAANRARATS
jgi:cellulase/cellobiase CelA1